MSDGAQTCKRLWSALVIEHACLICFPEEIKQRRERLSHIRWRLVSQNHSATEGRKSHVDRQSASVALPLLLRSPSTPRLLSLRRGSLPRIIWKNYRLYRDNSFSQNPANDPGSHFRLAFCFGDARGEPLPQSLIRTVRFRRNLAPVSINYFDYNIILVRQGGHYGIAPAAVNKESRTRNYMHAENRVNAGNVPFAISVARSSRLSHCGVLLLAVLPWSQARSPGRSACTCIADGKTLSAI